MKTNPLVSSLYYGEVSRNKEKGDRWMEDDCIQEIDKERRLKVRKKFVETWVEKALPLVLTGEKDFDGKSVEPYVSCLVPQHIAYTQVYYDLKVILYISRIGIMISSFRQINLFI